MKLNPAISASIIGLFWWGFHFVTNLPSPIELLARFGILLMNSFKVILANSPEAIHSFDTFISIFNWLLIIDYIEPIIYVLVLLLGIYFFLRNNQN